MKLRSYLAIMVFALALGALPVAAQPSSMDAKATADSFQRAWATIFGRPYPARDAGLAGNTAEESFVRMWKACEPYLLPGDRKGASEAMRLVVLGDDAPVREALGRTMRSGSLVPQDGEAVLWYALLLEEASDASLLPKLLPPGKGAIRLKSAVAARGGDWSAFLNRTAAWVAQRAVASGELRMEASSLPAVWVVDHDLPPGGFTAWRLSVPAWVSAVRGEAIGGSGSERLRLISVFASEGGDSTASGLGALVQPSILLPRGGDYLWLFLWNPPGGDPAGFGMTVTLWSDLNPPFQVREARLCGGACDLTLSETPGLAGYLLRTAGPEGALSPAAPPFASEGPGINRYHLLLNHSPSAGSKFELQALTSSGGTSALPLEVEQEKTP